MHPIKQALITYKANWKESLLLGAATAVFTFFAQVVPFAGALIISLGLLVFQELTNLRLETGKWKLDLSHLRQHWLSLAITTIILMPTGILLGSAFGMMESPQSKWESLPLSLGLLTLGVYFYLILSHGFRREQTTQMGVAKSLDLAAIHSIRNFRLYLAASFYISLALMLGSFVRVIGFVLTSPLIFYVSYYVFVESMAAQNRNDSHSHSNTTT